MIMITIMVMGNGEHDDVDDDLDDDGADDNCNFRLIFLIQHSAAVRGTCLNCLKKRLCLPVSEL